MGFHTFTAGEVLTAANVNSYLMNQVVIVCTSGTRPASPVTGMTIYETDTGNLYIYSGTAWVLFASNSAWTTYTPTFVNCTSPVGVFASKLEGKKLRLRGTFTGGTCTSTPTFTLPAGMTAVTIAGSGASQPLAATSIAADGKAWQAYCLSGATAVTFTQAGVPSVASGTGLNGLGFAGVIEVA